MFVNICQTCFIYVDILANIYVPYAIYPDIYAQTSQYNLHIWYIYVNTICSIYVLYMTNNYVKYIKMEHFMYVKYMPNISCICNIFDR